MMTKKKIATCAGTVMLALSGTFVVADSAQAADHEMTQENLKGDCEGNGELKNDGEQVDFGGGGEPYTKGAGHLDKCTFEETSHEVKMEWKAVGDTMSNCSSDRGKMTGKIGGTETITTGYSIGGKVGADSLPFSIFSKFGVEGNASYNWSKAVSATHEETIEVEPGRKAVQTVGIEVNHRHGRTRVNYDKPIDGHYVWYIENSNLDEPTGKTEKGQDNKDCSKKLINGQ